MRWQTIGALALWAPLACVGGTTTDEGTTDDGETDGVTDVSKTASDTDSDGVMDDVDNCMDTPNADQMDGDKDGVGDACDNCMDIVNAEQADADEDAVGDGCDNCPDIGNADQANEDADGWGDACDDVVDVVNFRMETDEKRSDCLSKEVCITRGSNGGIFNSVSEKGFYSAYSEANFGKRAPIPESPVGALIKVGFAGMGGAYWSYGQMRSQHSLYGPLVSMLPMTVKLDADDAEFNVMFTSWEGGNQFNPKDGGWDRTNAKTRGFGWTRAAVVAFEKPDDADHTDVVNQDCITPSVCLTRGASQGIYNIAQEASYGNASPMGTEWATGNTWDALTRGETYDTFANTVDSPRDAIGLPLSLHIVGTDLYYDVVLTAFTGGGPGGGFAWKRSRALVPGCMDDSGDNYDPVATVDMGYCDSEWTMFYRPPGKQAWQDCVSKDVCITRGDGGGGLYNAVSEKSFDKVSPDGTWWVPTSVDGAANWYTTWVDSHDWWTPYFMHRTYTMWDIEDTQAYEIEVFRWQNGNDNPYAEIEGFGSFAYARRAVEGGTPAVGVAAP